MPQTEDDFLQSIAKLFDPLPIGILLIENNTSISYANPFVFTVLGIEPPASLPPLSEMLPDITPEKLAQHPSKTFSHTDLQTPIKSHIPITYTAYPIDIKPHQQFTVLAFLDQVSSYQIQTLFEEISELTSNLSEQQTSIQYLLNNLQSGIIWGNTEEIWYTNYRVKSFVGSAQLATITDIFANKQKILHYLNRKIAITNLEMELTYASRTIPCLINISFVPYRKKAGWLIEILDIEEKKKIENSIMDITQSIIQERNELRQTQKSFSRDLHLAREIQYSLLPHQEYASLSYLYIPMEEIGGDFLDIFTPTPETLLVFLSDVCGHGIAASLLTVMIKQKLLELQNISSDPGILLTQLNKSLYYQLNGYFFTAICFLYNTTSHTISIANAGHPYPFLISNKHISTLATERRQPIGTLPNITYPTSTLTLQPGTRLFLYTDGLLESSNENLESFEETELQSSFQRHITKSSYEFLQAILEDLRLFHKKRHLDDDIALICLEII